MSTSQNFIAKRRIDGSFLINDGLYHVPNMGEYKEKWEELNAIYLEKPELFEQLTEENSYTCNYCEEEKTLDDLFSSLREARDYYLTIYDKKISQLQRNIYFASSENEREKINEQILALHAYAERLCDLPSLTGAPWDGGGPMTPWPECPV